jgi:hypothetical protein
MTRLVLAMTGLLSVVASEARGEAPVVHGEATPAAPPAPIVRPWSLMLSGGLATDSHLVALREIGEIGGYYPRAWQLELVKVRPDRLMWGGGFDVATGVAPGAGAFVLGGFERRLGRLRAEATAGLGIEQAVVAEVKSVWTGTIPSGPVQEPTISTTFEHRYVPYARVFGTLGLELTPAFDLVMRLGLHTIVAASRPDPNFFEGGLGVRYRLP